jgi:hypothetical protein
MKFSILFLFAILNLGAASYNVYTHSYGIAVFNFGTFLLIIAHLQGEK